MKSLLLRVLRLFDRTDDWRLAAIFVLTLIGAVVETIGVALIPAFVALLSSPETVIQMLGQVGLAHIAPGEVSQRVIFSASLLLAAFFLLKNLFLLTVVYLQARFMADQQAKLGNKLLTAYLDKPYAFHLNRNTAQLLRTLDTEIGQVFMGVVTPSFLLLSEVLVVAMVGLMLVVIAPVTSVVAVVAVGGTTLLYYRLLRKQMAKLGASQQYHGREMLKWINQSLGGIKETKVLRREKFFISAYRSHIVEYVRATRLFNTASQAPRYVIETIAMVGMLVVIVVMALGGREMTAILPSLALFAVAAIRLMPSMNRILGAAHSIRYYLPAVDAVQLDLLVPGEDYATRPTGSAPDESVSRTRPFLDKVQLDSVSFRYPGAVFDSVQQVSLDIPRGASVAFVGSSGAGKTTLVDLVLGLLEPTQGTILMDGVDIRSMMIGWQHKLGYIPQSIYLSDDSVRRNVAFGVADEDISDRDVWSALEDAQLAEVVRDLPEGLDSLVGERGVRLSGGQRQRIGIARALYHRPEILIMDEATAALDNHTEREIIDVLNRFRGTKTMIIIAHRLSTVRDCDTLFYLTGGRLAAQGTYDELLEASEDFKLMVR